MDNSDQNIDDISQKLKKANDDLARLTKCVAGIINGNKMSKKADNKNETSGINKQLLEMQLELVVNEKDEIEKKLVAVETQRDNFERELRELKSRYEKQETKLEILRREFESMNRNHSENLDSIVQCETQVRSTRLAMERSSGIAIRRKTAIESRTLAETKHPSNAFNKRRASQAIVEEHRPKRTLRCTLCSKQYVSTPTQALYYC